MGKGTFIQRMLMAFKTARSQERSHTRFSDGTMDTLRNGWKRSDWEKNEAYFLALGVVGMARDLANYEGEPITQRVSRKRFGLVKVWDEVEIGKRYSTVEGYEVTLIYDALGRRERLSVVQQGLEAGTGELLSVLLEPRPEGPNAIFEYAGQQRYRLAETLAAKYYKLGKSAAGKREGVGGDITDYTMRGWMARFSDMPYDEGKLAETRTTFQKMKASVTTEKMDEEEKNAALGRLR